MVGTWPSPKLLTDLAGQLCLLQMRLLSGGFSDEDKQYFSSTSPASFSQHRALDTCSPANNELHLFKQFIECSIF
jgi:hypothetical protein